MRLIAKCHAQGEALRTQFREIRLMSVSCRAQREDAANKPLPIVVHSTTPPFTMSKSPRLQEKPHAAAADAAPAKLVIQTRAIGEVGGGERIRTVDLLVANQALSQLSYAP